MGGSVPPFFLIDGLCEGTVLGVDDDVAPPAKRKRLELGLPPRLRAHNASATSLLAQEEPEHGMIACGSAVGSKTMISMATQIISHRLAHPRRRFLLPPTAAFCIRETGRNCGEPELHEPYPTMVTEALSSTRPSVLRSAA